ncbi:glycoside hydrolase [Kitasatospora sp. NPDC096077]|uniref:glycoside hydrolase n=1 Tax=Kitasatospora sp. NPDC096077 TaxID=3155544 RepID=UPI0033213BD9
MSEDTVQDPASDFEPVISGTFDNYPAFEAQWNYLYPWGSDHNGTARMYAGPGDHDHVYLENGVLTLKASRVTKDEGSSSEPPYAQIRYRSGAVHAKQRITVTSEFPNYEIKGEFQAPALKGAWPAFWLDGSWPPESDILEFKGDAVNWFNTFRTSDDLDSTPVPVPHPAHWHTYVAWIEKVNDTDVTIDYYLDTKDGKPLWRARGHGAGYVGKPMSLIINLQMEGSSGHPGPDGDTYFRARNVYVGRTRTRPHA